MFTNYRELLNFVQEKGIEIIDFKIATLNGRWNHLSIPSTRLDEKLFASGIGFDGSSYGYAAIENSDMVFYPDVSTSFIDPFCTVPTLGMIANIYNTGANRSRYSGDPRFIARRAEDYMKELKIADEYLVAPEFEFYLFDHISYEVTDHHQEVTIDSGEAPWNTNNCGVNQGYKIHDQGGYHVGLPSDRSNDMRSEIVIAMEKMGIPVKYHHHEVGAAGQLEIEVESAPMLKMADRTMLTKYIIKNTAFAHGKTATFMPKPLYNQAGSGMHIHMQLKKDGHNVFYGKGGYSDLSQNALCFIGGILKHSPSLLAFTNPSTNSYKRLVPGFEAPVSICFGIANRTAVIRIPGYADAPDTRRFEFRPSDGTCNPYIAYSALLMAGIDGIVKGIDPAKEGFGPMDVNVFELPENERMRIGSLPKSLEEALHALESDNEYLQQGGVFSSAFIERWISNKYENEVLKVMPSPTPQEFELYFDV